VHRLRDEVTVDGKTLMAAMTYPGYPAPLSLSRYEQLAGSCNEALLRAGCTTVQRVAMFLAQTGAESGSLRWTEELADGSAYNGRLDLGNTHPGDGPRFKGRSFIQVTGRDHYANLSRWAAQHDYVPTSTFFIDHPEWLAEDRYAFLGPVWYWTVARPRLNLQCDASDVAAATWSVNGGYSNLAGRMARWSKCLTLGDALLPSSGAAPDSSSQHSLTSRKAGRMFEILFDVDTKVWYAWTPGYWRRIASRDELVWASHSALCVNGASVRGELAKPEAERTYPHIGLSNAHIIIRERLALGG
jgi:predicted chitinase